jgi:hypothetical protein
MARYDQCTRDCTTDCGHCKGNPPQWAIVDNESAGPGEIATVVFRAETYGDCIWWLVKAEDQKKVERGGYSIDEPADD